MRVFTAFPSCNLVFSVFMGEDFVMCYDCRKGLFTASGRVAF